MAHIPTPLHRTIIRQHGVVSSTQLAAAGVTFDQRRGLVAAGAITRVTNGAYRVATTPDTLDARCVAIGLTRPDVIVCGVTAGRLHGFRRLPADQRLHVLLPHGARPPRVDGLRAYRPIDATRRRSTTRPDGVRMLAAADTIVDLARCCDRPALSSIVEQAIANRWCSTSTILRAASELHRVRRPWLDVLEDVLGQRLLGGAAESDGEVQLGAALRARGIRGLERQHRLQLDGIGAIRFDMAIPELRWALEVDLHPSHFDVDGAERDARRDLAAAAVGWCVRRVTPDEFTSVAALADRLVAEIAQRRADSSRAIGDLAAS